MPNRVEIDGAPPPDAKKGVVKRDKPLFSPGFDQNRARARLANRNQAPKVYKPATLPKTVIPPARLWRILNNYPGIAAGWWAPQGASHREVNEARDHRLRLVEHNARLIRRAQEGRSIG